MSGNAIFLVCAPCEAAQEPDFGVKLCERAHISWYEHSVPTKQFDAWLSKHRKCGGRNNPDHFRLGHLFQMNHDQLPTVSPIAEAIRLNGSN